MHIKIPQHIVKRNPPHLYVVENYDCEYIRFSKNCKDKTSNFLEKFSSFSLILVTTKPMNKKSFFINTQFVQLIQQCC